jgi:hypothetical protein
VLFFTGASEEIPDREGVLNALRLDQMDGGPDDGGWAILSLGGRPTVEGTVWPLLALKAAGDQSDLDRVQRAERWIVERQNNDGGWGSTTDNRSRVVLTTAAMTALQGSRLQFEPALLRAHRWLKIHQRNSEGSWGPAPGEPGTVAHTCLALMALADSGASPTDPVVAAGRRFLLDRWNPDPSAIHQETYDAHFGNSYSRVFLEHDVDALVCRASLRMGGPGDLARALEAGSGLARTPIEAVDASPISLWTVLPRGFAAVELAQHLPRDVRTRGNENVLVTLHGSRRRVVGSLMSIAWKEAGLAPRHPLRWLVAVLLLVSAATTVLFVLGEIAVGEFLLGLVVPLVLAAITLLRGESRG